mmetsp:Transcript_446/g.796  ORF Transcript_446/g.796 Transcript_446/m.796 type:complete len:147 (+) Transcript_446:178-618(+)
MGSLMASGAQVCPGDRLGDSVTFAPGRGSHVHGAYVCASLVGTLQVVPADHAAPDSRTLVQVLRGSKHTLVPKPGDIVTGKVTKINSRFAAVDILCVGRTGLDEKFQGIIRQQDVRATEIDKVQIVASFRPGDVVRAQVVRYIHVF